MSGRDGLKERIREEAARIGFDACGFTEAHLPQAAGERLAAFLSGGAHGDMDWLENRAGERSDPQTLWPEAKSVIMLGANYGPADNPLDLLEQKTRGAISVYARNQDYHDVVKKRLKRLARWLVETISKLDELSPASMRTR